nr:unnamed protein product [Callosobruchus chinensis]
MTTTRQATTRYEAASF